MSSVVMRNDVNQELPWCLWQKRKKEKSEPLGHPLPRRCAVHVRTSTSKLVYIVGAALFVLFLLFAAQWFVGCGKQDVQMITPQKCYVDSLSFLLDLDGNQMRSLQPIIEDYLQNEERLIGAHPIASNEFVDKLSSLNSALLQEVSAVLTPIQLKQYQEMLWAKQEQYYSYISRFERLAQQDRERIAQSKEASPRMSSGKGPASKEKRTGAPGGMGKGGLR